MTRLLLTYRRIHLVTLALAASLAVAAATASPPAWRSPIAPPHGAVVKSFDAPPQTWAAGHRGVDLAGPPGADVRAAATGTVTFAGTIAGRGVMVVEHNGLRSTYEPVDPLVPPGTRVQTGEPIATLSDVGSHCAPATCLHWGVRDGSAYRDPLQLLEGPRSEATDNAADVVLLPIDERALSGDAPSRSRTSAGSADLIWPVDAPHVTSAYGMRTHPVTGEHKLHDGTDFRAPCGTAIRAVADGEVTRAGRYGAYGIQVALDHRRSAGDVSATSYSHLSRLAVATGRSVRAGQVIGWSGTTGRSTGCHLHFMVRVGGATTDPMAYLNH